MDDLLTRFIGPLVRAGLLAVSGWFAARGFTFDENFWVDAGIAITTGLVALIWSLYQKAQASKLAQTALDFEPGTPLAAVKAAVGGIHF